MENSFNGSDQTKTSRMTILRCIDTTDRLNELCIGAINISYYSVLFTFNVASNVREQGQTHPLFLRTVRLGHVESL